jgi:hypothetical protein
LDFSFKNNIILLNTTETKKECGCIEIKREHDFFDDKEYITIFCHLHNKNNLQQHKDNID